jgi:Uma2 family endonuclease
MATRNGYAEIMAPVAENTAASVSPVPLLPGMPPCENVYRLTVEQYHEMVRTGVLTPDDRVELLDGVLVKKLTKYPSHIYAEDELVEILSRLLPAGWIVRSQHPISLGTSEPEPDVAVVWGSRGDYATRHPTASEVLLLIEVSESSLAYDRTTKKQVYAQAGIAVYWIVNLVEKMVEVYTEPLTKAADYRVVAKYRAGESLPVAIAGQTLGTFDPAVLFG